MYALVGRAPRLLEEFVDQRLTDALGHILINRFERLAHRRILLRRERHDLALAGLLDRFQRVLVFFLRMALPYSVASFMAFSQLGAMSSGKPSQNFLLAMTTYPSSHGWCR